MKKIQIFLFSLGLVLFASCNKQGSGMDLSGECRVYTIAFNGEFKGTIGKTATIMVTVPEEYNRDSMVVSALTISQGATTDLKVGDLLNLREPRVFTVSCGDTRQCYTIICRNEEPVVNTTPAAVFFGTAETKAALQPEEGAAYQWMVDNIPGTVYASLEDIRSEKIRLDSCQILWWHFHRDFGIEGAEAFEKEVKDWKSVLPVLQRYFSKGGNFLFTRYATNVPGYLNINGALPTYRMPNNCWGGNEQTPDTPNDPWSFRMTKSDHPIYQGLAGDPARPEHVFLFSVGYSVTNTTTQWGMWGDYADHATFTTLTGATVLGKGGGDEAVVLWEFPSSANNGGIICIGTGCYDWYNAKDVYGGYHDNVGILTKNAINYLTNK